MKLSTTKGKCDISSFRRAVVILAAGKPVLNLTFLSSLFANNDGNLVANENIVLLLRVKIALTRSPIPIYTKTTNVTLYFTN